MIFSAPVVIKFQVKSPLFIGDGGFLTPLSYLMERNIIHVLNVERLLAQLSAPQKLAYTDWMDSIIQQLADLETKIWAAPPQQSFDLRRQRRQLEDGLCLQDFLLNKRIGHDPIALARKAGCIVYSVPWDVQPRPEGFRTFIKNANGAPFIPGSEIKGALRTSLLSYLLGEDEKYSVMRQELAEMRNMLRSSRSTWAKLKQLKDISGRVEGQILRPKGGKDKEGDAKFDFFKLVQIGDAPLNSGNLRIKALESMGTQRFTRAMVEGIGTGAEGSFRVALAETAEFSWALTELGLLELGQAQLSPEALLKAAHRRSADILAEDENYFSAYPNILQRIRNLQQENEAASPLLHLGMGQGFLSITVDLPVKERDPDLYEQAIREGVTLQRRWRTTPQKFPKTRRVVSDGRGNPVDLCGWIKLIRQ